uniref:BED-type domain-containing protein n=1 Tax=Anopheles quadriannulatus TaxID=34691 RepID=A0A182XPF9_ANOQN
MASNVATSSSIWDHFTRNGTKAKCRYCYNEIAFTKGSTSNLKRHMKAKHPSISLERQQLASTTSPSTQNSEPGLLSKMIIRKLNETHYTIPELGNLVTHLKEGVKKRLEIYSNNQMIAKSMLLDPRIKKQGFHEEPLKYRETYELIIQELIPFQTPSMNAQEPHNIDNEANLLL